MKKIFMLALMAVTTLVFYSCGEEDDSNGGNNSNNQGGNTSIVGNWTNSQFNNTAKFTNTDYEFVELGNIRDIGTYSYDGNIIYLTPKKYNNSNNVPQYSGATKFIYNSKVLVIQYDFDAKNVGTYDYFNMYFKNGATIPATTNEIQGKWFWYIGDRNTIRASFEFKNNNFEIIIPVYREFYKGTYTYNNGLITLNITSVKTREYQDESLSKLYDDWTIDKTYSSLENGYSFQFIPNGNEAFGDLVGLPVYSVKQ